MVKKVKRTVSWTYQINDLNGEEHVGTFYEKEMPKESQTRFRIEIVIKRVTNHM